MKKLCTTILILLTLPYTLLTMPYAAFAFSPTPLLSPTITPTVSKIDEQINSLKDRIASRVAQLKLVEKRGIIGTVSDTSQTQLTLTDTNGNTRFIGVDELTSFSSPNAKSGFGISDIAKGNTLGVLGLYNKESRRILARFITVLTLPTIISGAVTSIDSNNATITITTADLKDILINVETVTKTVSFSKTTGLSKSRFSKITKGERALVVGFPDTKNKNTIVASRFLRFPDLPINPKIPLFKPGDLQISPATGGGTKLVPVIKVQ